MFFIGTDAADFLSNIFDADSADTADFLVLNYY